MLLSLPRPFPWRLKALLDVRREDDVRPTTNSCDERTTEPLGCSTTRGPRSRLVLRVRGKDGLSLDERASAVETGEGVEFVTMTLHALVVIEARPSSS